MIGTTVGHYRLIERLGAGGMGEVFLAEDLRLGRQAAIKVIAEHLTRDEPRRLRFVQEARLAASIDHPNIAAIYDVDQDGGRTYIAMEYVRGHTLRELLRAGPLDPVVAIDLAIQIASALARVHERGVIHRDLKPDNVMVSADGYAKIIDFGLAKLVQPDMPAADAFAETTARSPVRTEDGMVLGTVPYMSPEQARGLAIDARSDIFSFGAVVYEMLTGTPAFRRSTAVDTLGAILREEPPALSLSRMSASSTSFSRLPATGALQRIINRCLTKDAAARYQTMREVEGGLKGIREEFRTGSEIRAGASRAWVFGSPRLMLGGGVAIALLAAVTFVWWRGGRSSDTDASSSSSDRGAISGLVAPAGHPARGRPAVAIVPFDSAARGGDLGWLAKGIPCLAGLVLGQTPDVEVVTRGRLNDGARTFGRDRFDAVDPAEWRLVVAQAGASAIVRGGILQVGSDLTIDTRVEDVATGKPLFVATVRGTDPLALADELAQKMRSGFAGHSADAWRPLRVLASSSIEAARQYCDGADALDGGRLWDAEHAFERALKADGGMALASLQWGVAEDLDRHGSQATAHFKDAMAHADRLPDRERLEAQAHVSAAAGKIDEARTVARGALDRFPDTERLYFFETSLTSAPDGVLADGKATAALLQKGTEALPASGALHKAYGEALLNLGRVADALKEFDADVRLRPKDPRAVEGVGDAYLVSHDPLKAIDAYRRVMNTNGSDARTGLAWAYAMEGHYDEALDSERTKSFVRAFLLSRVGRQREAEDAVQNALKRADRDDDAEMSVALVTLDGMMALDLGDCTATRGRIHEAAARIARLPEPVRARWTTIGTLIEGTCDARSGQPGAARAALARLRSTSDNEPADQRFWRGLLDADISLAAGDHAAAASAFTSGLPGGRMAFSRTPIGMALAVFGNSLVMRDAGARAMAEAGKLPEAIDEYRRLLNPAEDPRWTAALEPRHVIALARLLDHAGMKDEARAEFRKFLDLWSRADQDLPEVAEGQKGQRAGGKGPRPERNGAREGGG